MDNSSELPPWLMLPPKEKGSNERGFFSLSNCKSFHVRLPQGTFKKRCLSSKGWLLTIARNWSMHLLHPFSGFQIKLPHIKTFRDWDDGIHDATRNVFFIDKFVLSSSPLSNPDYTVMVLYGERRQLAYFKPGDKGWTTIDTGRGWCVDVIYYKDQFYAIKTIGKIFVCDLNASPAVAHQVMEMPHLPNQVPLRLSGKFYLVESSKRTLLAVRRGGGTTFEDTNTYLYGTHGFDVFKIDLSTNTWEEVKDIGNRSLFLGSNSSFSVEADNNSICKPNCIYFTDDNVLIYWGMRFGGGRDTGIYNIQESRFIPHTWDNLCDHLNPPIWIEQNGSDYSCDA